MNHDVPYGATNCASSIAVDAQEIIGPKSSSGTLTDSDASQAIVQCLLIAARRGRQIRLAREQAAQPHQSGSKPDCEEVAQSDDV